ncbi:MAG: OFA family MFS transporter [Treponema sp.]|nr:OFA family MFS transporter [Treponema sp.]
MLLNLSIGVLYAWSVINAQLVAPVYAGGWGWTSSQAGLPYTVTIIVFATAMLFGGRLQDKIGPRRVVMLGSVLAGTGIALSGLVGNSVIGITLCFGVIAGTGMGFAYGSVTPPALKWFHPGKKGMISGLVVAGFGLSAVYYAPLAAALLGRFGIETTLLILGAGVLVVSLTVSQFIKNPPPGYIPPLPANAKQTAAKTTAAVDFTRTEMLKTRRFYMMFVMFLLASSVGLMIIGNITRIAQTQAFITDSALLAMLVALLAMTNTLGRVIGGIISDKIGRIKALYMVFIVQMLNMSAFMFYQNMLMLIIGIIGVGFCFGTLLSVFPALTADHYGLKNIGANYGIMFMAWGLAGVVAPVIANYLYDSTGNFHTAYIICAVMMAAMIFVNYFLQKDIAARSN